MNILIDIGHPGHVHLMHSISSMLQSSGHSIYYSVRDVPIAKRLMNHYCMTPFEDLGNKSDSLMGKAFAVLHQDGLLLNSVLSHNIDIGLSSGISLGHISKVTHMKSIMFDDDDDNVEPLVVKYGHPFTDIVFTPASIKRKTKNAVYYKGTHELAYLHPNRFTPDPKVLEHAGIRYGERYFVMRFVAMKGHHDVGEHGLNRDQKMALIRLLKKHGRVIITSERAIEPEFETYRLPVPPEEMHSLMAFSSMFIGDSQTMTSEAAVLGVPALKCNSFAGRLSVPNMLEHRYGLCYAYPINHFCDMIDRIEHLLLLNPEDLKNEWNAKRQKLLNEMVDPTSFFVKYLEKHYGLHT